MYDCVDHSFGLEAHPCVNIVTNRLKECLYS